MDAHSRSYLHLVPRRRRLGLVDPQYSQSLSQGTNIPGGNFGLQVNGEVLSAFACFTYNEASPPSTGRVPTTLSVVTPLSNSGPTSVVAVWSGVRGATVRIDSPATLTGIIA